MYDVLAPDSMTLHYKHLPTGEWWERAVPYLRLRRIEASLESYKGRRITTYAHMADVARLQLLLQFGGIYLDLDVLVVNSMEALRHHGAARGGVKRE